MKFLGIFTPSEFTKDSNDAIKHHLLAVFFNRKVIGICTLDKALKK